MNKFTLILSFFIFSITSTFGQTVIDGDFEAPLSYTSWNGCGASVEIGPENSYGGTSSSNSVCEIDSEKQACQSIGGFIIGETYEISITASRRVYDSSPSSTPDPVDAIISIDGGALSWTIVRSGAFNLVTETQQFTATQTTHALNINVGPLNTTTFGIVLDDITISVATSSCDAENGVLSIGN